MKPIRLLKPWKCWSIGHVIPDMPPNQASLLIDRGIAEHVRRAKKPAAVTATGATEVMRAGNDYLTR